MLYVSNYQRPFGKPPISAIQEYKQENLGKVEIHNISVVSQYNFFFLASIDI